MPLRHVHLAAVRTRNPAVASRYLRVGGRRVDEGKRVRIQVGARLKHASRA